LALLLASALALPPRHKGLRGIALVDFSDPKAPRLMPIAILADDTLYDANTYLAQPRPLAVEPGNIYDVTKAGEHAGSFRISDAHQMKGMWYGDGRFMTPQMQQRASRRTTTSSGGDDDRPILRRPGSNNPPQTTTTTPPPDTANVNEPPPEDEGRPTLRRGVPQQPSAPPTPPPSKTTDTMPLPQKTTDHPRLMVAVSDPTYNDFPSFAFTTKPEFEQQYKKAALAELAKAFAAAPLQGKLVGAAGLPAITDFRIFDLTARNEPTVVLTATREVTVQLGTAQRRRVRWGAIIMRVNADGTMDKLLTSVTDPDHLDATPQLTLVDAVDLYGNGRGELLFQQRSDEGRTFAIYGPARGGFTKLFETSLPVQ
jgi:hypothetical protein